MPCSQLPTASWCLPSQVSGQLRAAELDAALAAVDAEEAAELAALREAGTARQADAVRSHSPTFASRRRITVCLHLRTS